MNSHTHTQTQTGSKNTFANTFTKDEDVEEEVASFSVTKRTMYKRLIWTTC